MQHMNIFLKKLMLNDLCTEGMLDQQIGICLVLDSFIINSFKDQYSYNIKRSGMSFIFFYK